LGSRRCGSSSSSVPVSGRWGSLLLDSWLVHAIFGFLDAWLSVLELPSISVVGRRDCILVVAVVDVSKD